MPSSSAFCFFPLFFPHFRYFSCSKRLVVNSYTRSNQELLRHEPWRQSAPTLWPHGTPSPTPDSQESSSATFSPPPAVRPDYTPTPGGDSAFRSMRYVFAAFVVVSVGVGGCRTSDIDTETHARSYKETHRHTDTQRVTNTYRHTYRRTGALRQRDAETLRHSERERERETERQRETERERDDVMVSGIVKCVSSSSVSSVLYLSEPRIHLCTHSQSTSHDWFQDVLQARFSTYLPNLWKS